MYAASMHKKMTRVWGSDTIEGDREGEGAGEGCAQEVWRLKIAERIALSSSSIFFSPMQIEAGCTENKDEMSSVHVMLRVTEAEGKNELQPLLLQSYSMRNVGVHVAML